MAKYTIEAIQTNYCTVEIEAESQFEAYKELDSWIEDDLLEYRTQSDWEFTVDSVE